MPLTELDPNVSGRASRASNVSVSSRDKRSRQQAAQSAQSDLLSSTGVMSMLRTSTELGDIAGMTFGKGSRSSHKRPAHRRRSNNASSRLSVSSSHTQMTGMSNHHPRPSSSSAPRRSMTNSLNAPVFLPDTLSPTQMNIPGASPLVPPARLSKDGRSFSLTSNYAPAHKLSKPRSFASLRHPELAQRPRSPYRYPTRLKRPGYRSPSPAMSDVTGLQSRRPRHPGHSSIPRPRNSPVLPMMPLDMGQMQPLPVGLQGSVANAIQVSPLQPHEMVQMPYQHAHFNRSTPTIIGVSPINEAVPRRRPVPGGSHPMLLKPMAMRPGTSLSQSTESDIPSSGAVSLAPQTPKLHHEAQVMIQPNSPHTLNTPNSPVDEHADSEELIYYDYSEHFVNEEPKSQSPAPAEAASVIPGGFVNHVKNILEGQGRIGSSPVSTPSPGNPVTPIEELGPEIFELPGSPVPTPPREAVELPAEPVPRRITREMILSVIEPSATTNGNDTTMTVEAKVVENVVPVRVPSRSHSPMPSVPSNGSMSTAQEQPEVGPGVASTTDGDDAPVRHSIETRSSGLQDDNRASAVDFHVRYSVPVTQGSIDSTQSFSVDDSEPQVQLDITPETVGANVNPAEDELEDDMLVTEESTGRSPFGRAKSLSVPKSPKIDVEARFSAPTLGSGQVEEERIQAPECRIHVQVSPPVSTNDVLAAQPALEALTSQPDNQALHSAYDTPDPSPAMYSDEGTPASATQQSSSPASIPAKSFSSRESNNTTTHLVWPLRRQTVNNAAFQADEEYPSRGSLMNETISIAKDLRLSNPPRYPSQLSDVKEESCEESFSDLSKRASTRASQNFKFPYSRGSATATDVGSSVDLGRRTSMSFKFPLPGRSSARRTSIEEMFVSRTPSVRASAPVFRSPKRTKGSNGSALVESRLIPSMHFSQMDLLEKLSEAFGDGARLSLDGVPPEFEVEIELMRERPASLGPIREKYRSFFASLDSTDRVPDFRPKTPVTETVEVAKPKPVVEIEVEKEPEPEPEREREHVNEQQTETEVRSLRSDTAMSTRDISRPYSPEEVLEEVERLSVPSMAGLTARLSELIPSLKKYRSSENVDEDVEDMIEDDELKADVEEMRHVGERPGLLNNMKSSRRLRPLPGKTSLVLVDDDIYEELTLREKEKREKGEVNVLRYHHHHRIEEMSSSSDSYKSAQEERKISMADDDDCKKARRKTPMAELEAPLPVHLRRSNEIESAAKKPDDGSDWDLANVKFPSAIDIDISFPIKAHVRDGDRTSVASSSSSEYSLTSATIKNAADAIGVHGDVNPTTTVTAQSHSTLADSTSTHDTFKNTHSRHNSRRQSGAGTSRPCTSVLGTLTRKMGMGSIMSSSHRHHSHHLHSHNVCNPSDPNHTHSHIYLARRTLSPNPTLTHPSISLDDTHPVDPGDRYPTTGLTPPQGRFNINIDDVRSFFSDDSSQTKGAGGLRKRLTGLRLRLAGAGPSTATAATAQNGNNANSKNPTPVTDTASSLIPLGGGGSSAGGAAGASTSFLTPLSPLPTLSPSTRRDSPSAITSEEPSTRSGGTLSLLPIPISLPLPLRGGGKTGDGCSSSGAGEVSVVMSRPRFGTTSAVQPAVAAAAAGQGANGRGVDGPGGPGGLGMGMSRVEFRTKRMLEKLKSFWFSLGRSLLMAAAAEREREKKRRGSHNGGGGDDGNGGRESVLIVREREREEEVVLRDGNHVEVERVREVDIDVQVAADKRENPVEPSLSPQQIRHQHLTPTKVPTAAAAAASAVLGPTLTSSTTEPTEHSSDLVVVHPAPHTTAAPSIRGSSIARGRPSTTAARSSRRSSTYTTSASANSTTRLVPSTAAASASGSRRSCVRPRRNSSCPGSRSRPGSRRSRGGAVTAAAAAAEEEVGGGGQEEAVTAGPVSVSKTTTVQTQMVAVMRSGSGSGNGGNAMEKDKEEEKEKEEVCVVASSEKTSTTATTTTNPTNTTQTAPPNSQTEASGNGGGQQRESKQNTDSSVASLDAAQLAALKFVGVVDVDEDDDEVEEEVKREKEEGKKGLGG
ncbi:hypothetical protein IWZ03DRAFT_421715 [Phyllosticta citriasiana]|uniref:Uncharacterized protein n=1 Tax=Phyllosticta citriasiana TaxID=595635 RepID=A0ABR1KR91_9PEZI